MGKSVAGGVSRIVTDGFAPWWANHDGAAEVDYRTETLTAREAYDSALNWEVERAQVAINFGTEEDPHWVLDRSRIGVIRRNEDKILGVHSEGYGIVQNETLLDFAEALKTLGDVYVKSAGTLYDDKIAWMLVKIGEDKHFADRSETIEKYLLGTTSHDGSVALSERSTNVRVECENTFDWAVKGSKALVQLRHTRNVQDYLAQAERTLKEAYNHYDAIDKEIDELLNEIKVSKRQFIDKVVPALVGDEPGDDATSRAKTLHENRRNGLVEAWNRPDQANIAGTGWGAVMAVNSFENWTQSVRGTTRSEAQARRAVRGDYPLTTKAKNLLLAR